jgi:hypothetical protein
MPIAIIPDIDEQRCIGCALCVEICTALGPDVLRVKPVEGWKRGLLSRKVHFRRRLSRCLPNTCYLLDEANGVHLRSTSPSAQEWCVRQGLGRRLSRKLPATYIPLFTFLFSNPLKSLNLLPIVP